MDKSNGQTVGEGKQSTHEELTNLVDRQQRLGVGGVNVGSKTAMVRACFTQTYRQAVTPGVPVSDKLRAKMSSHGLGDQEQARVLVVRT